jgi:hypothetical protein
VEAWFSEYHHVIREKTIERNYMATTRKKKEELCALPTKSQSHRYNASPIPAATELRFGTARR